MNKNVKDKEERKYQVKNLLNQINNFDIKPDMFPEIKEFHKICFDYINNGLSQNGKIHLEVVNRDLVYILPNAKHINASITLKYKKYNDNI